MNFSKFTTAAAVSTALLFSSCAKDQCTRTVTYTKHTPVYRTYDQIRQPIVPQQPRELRAAGKIFLHNNYLLVNEPHAGVHIFDIQNPSNPQNLAFIPIEGSQDLSMRNNTLFADNYTDLVAVDLSNMSQPRIVARAQNVFPIFGADDQGMIVDYLTETVTEQMDCAKADEILMEQRWGMGGLWTLTNGTMAMPARNNTGTGASMSRFALYDKFLYCVDQSSLHVLDVSGAEAGNMEELVQTTVGWNIETIFPTDRNLFIGSQTGMFIYDISNPIAPNQVGQFSHAQACDPVFVSGNTAYVTLRSGTACNNGVNELITVDVTNVSQPREIATYPMHNPHGLSVRNNNELFLCEGDAGLKMFDASNPANVAQNILSSKAGIHAVDVINVPNSSTVVAVGKDGLHIYNASDLRNLVELSIIPVRVP